MDIIGSALTHSDILEPHYYKDDWTETIIKRLKAHKFNKWWFSNPIISKTVQLNRLHIITANNIMMDRPYERSSTDADILVYLIR